MTTVLSALTVAWAWVLAHPAYAWPLISALVTVALKPRSPAQYAAMAAMWPTWFWSRFAPLLQLVGALGLDPVKALAVIGKVFTGKQDSSGRPPMGGLVAVLALACVVGSASGCAALAQDAKFLPTPQQSECVLTDIDKSMPARAIVTDCGLELNAVAFIESLLVGRKQQLAHARAAASLDGGAPPSRTLNFANDNDAGKGADAGK